MKYLIGSVLAVVVVLFLTVAVTVGPGAAFSDVMSWLPR